MVDPAKRLAWLDVFDRILVTVTLIVGGLLLTFMTIFGTVNVILMRKMLNAPIVGAEDLLVLALILVVAISIPFGSRVGAHIEIEVLESRMSPGFARWSMFVLKGLGAGLMLLMAYELIKAGANATRFGETTQQLLISYEPFYYVLALCVALYAIVLISDAIQLILRGEIRQIDIGGTDFGGAE